MDRLDVELYAERLARWVERAADDLADARLRAAWCELEAALECALAPADCDRLRRLGVLGGPQPAASLDRRVAERAEDLAALQRLQAAVERHRAGRRQTGVTATSSPPSSS